MMLTRRPRHRTALLWALCLSSADSFLLLPGTTLRRRTGTSTSRPLPNADHSKIKPNNHARPIVAATTDNSSNQPAQDDEEEEEEWHPRDPAYTIPQLLEGVWFQISQGKTMVKGDSITVLYPQMEDEYLNNPRFMNLLFAHLDACKDVCDHFGITTTLTPYREKKRGNKISGFQVQSFRNPDREGEDGGGDNNKEFQFEYDPIWDDGTDFEALYDGIDDVDIVPDKYPAIEKPVPDSDDEIMELTKNWVAAVVSDMVRSAPFCILLTLHYSGWLLVLQSAMIDTILSHPLVRTMVYRCSVPRGCVPLPRAPNGLDCRLGTSFTPCPVVLALKTCTRRFGKR
jgi:hypothetical protein